MIKQLKMWFFGTRPKIHLLGQIGIDELLYNIDSDNIQYNYIKRNDSTESDLELILPIKNCVQIENKKWTKHIHDAIHKIVPESSFEIYEYVKKMMDNENDNK